MNIITRDDAIKNGLNRYYTGEKCKNGHIAQKVVSKKACTECIRLQKKRARKEQSVQMYSSLLRRSAKHRAKQKGLEFNLTHEWVFEKLKKGTCEVTGLPIKLPDGTGTPGPSCFSPSLDRINPKNGYTIENTRLVTHSYNAAKNDGTDEDVLIMARALIKKYGM